MYCPFCSEVETKVMDSRLVSEGQQVRRRRECITCGERFTTYEVAELLYPQIVKRNGSRSPFHEGKLRAGLNKALEKRPVQVEQVESMIQRLLNRIRSKGERELSSNLIGEWVMQELRQLDPVAYVRFASVYRSFQDVEAFNKEIENLQKNKLPSENSSV